MPACAVFSCKKESRTSSLQKDGVTFHLFPQDRNLRKKWVDACNRHPSWASTRTSTICSLHFEPSLFQKLSNNRRKLVLGAIPTLFLNDSITEQVQHKQQIIIEEDSKSQDYMIHLLPPPQPCVTPASNEIVMTPKERKLVRCVKAKTQQIKRLQSKVLYLKKKVSSLEEIIKDLKEKS